MKKMLALILALAMVLSMSVTAFAENLTGNGSENTNVTVQVTEPVKVYKINITWDSLQFVYALGTWSTEKHIYEGGKWDNTSAKITVVNHSNADVNVEATVSDQTTADNVTVTYPKTGKFVLLSAADVALNAPTAIDKANAKIYTVSVSGTPTKAMTETVVGKITITISCI